MQTTHVKVSLLKNNLNLTSTLIWPWPWCMILTLLMTCGHIQMNNKLKQVNNDFFTSLWPWPNDIDTQIWPRYDQDIPPYQKWSSYVKRFKSYSLNSQTHRHIDTHTDRQTDRQTDRHNRKHYLPAFAGGNNNNMWLNFRGNKAVMLNVIIFDIENKKLTFVYLHTLKLCPWVRLPLTLI